MLANVFSGLKRSWELKKLILVFWILNLISAIVFLRPYLKTFNTFFSDRLVTHILAQTNIHTYYNEFYHFMGSAVQVSKQIFSIGIVIHLILTILLGGGLIHYFVREEKINFRIFWVQSGRFIGRMFRLALWTLLSIPLAIFAGILLVMLTSNFLPEPFVENVYFYFYFGWLIVIGLLVLFVFMIVDSAKIILVKNEEDSTRKCLKDSLKLFLNQPFQLLGSYIFIFLLELILFSLYWWLQKFIPDTHVWGIVSGFIVLQLGIFLLFWIRFSRYGMIADFVKKNILTKV